MVQNMNVKKSSTLNLRIDPNLKSALKIAAEKDHRSLANMLEVLIIKHCEDKGIPFANTMQQTREK